MPVLRIAELGNPILREKAHIVSDPSTHEIKRVIQDLWDTKESLRAAGLAAPQIHVSYQVIVLGLAPKDAAETARSEIPPLTLINPGYEPLSDEMDVFWEASFSIPGYRGIVPRYRHIRYWGTHPDGTHVEGSAWDYHARLIQHECDHLNGILYIDQLQDLTTLVSNNEFHHWVNKRLSGDPRYGDLKETS